MDAPASLPGRLRAMFVAALYQWIDDRAMSKAAALAFYTLFSLAPVVVIVLAIAGAVFGDEAAEGALFGELRKLVGPSGAQAVQLMLSSTRNPEAGMTATVMALGLLVVGATTVFGELKDSLDQIWKVPAEQQSGFALFIRTRLLSFGMILVLAFLLLVSLAVNAALAAAERVLSGYWGGAAAVMTPVTAVVSFGVIVALFAAIYKLLPQVHLSWRDVAIGALVTALLFQVGKAAIGAYLGHNAFVTGFGAASSVIALMMWVYYSALIFFFGAELTHQYAHRLGSRRRKPPP